MTLHGYILKRFLLTTLRVLLILVLIIMLIDAVENIRFLSKKDASFDQMIRYSLLKAPKQIYGAFPLIILISALTTFLGLARSSELIVTRACGVSALKILATPIAASLLMGAFSVVVLNPIVASTSRGFDAYRATFEKSFSSPLSISDDGLWFRQGTHSGQTVIQAERTNATGTRLFLARFHHFGNDGNLESRIDAERATLIPGYWLIQGATLWDFTSTETALAPSVEKVAEMRLETDLTPSQIAESFAPPQAVSIWNLSEFIERLEKSGFSAIRHRQFLQSEIASPLLFVAMTLIGAAFTMRHARFGRTGIMVLLAVLSGFSLYFFKDVLNSFGSAGVLPIEIAVWTPPLAAIMLSLGLLLHLEDG